MASSEDTLKKAEARTKGKRKEIKRTERRVKRRNKGTCILSTPYQEVSQKEENLALPRRNTFDR
jgi:hypothetical protein